MNEEGIYKSSREVLLYLALVIIIPTIGSNYEAILNFFITIYSWLTVGDWQSTRIGNPSDFWANIATIASALIAFVGLGAIYLQLNHNAKQARRLKTWEISGKLQDTEFLEHLSIALVYFRDNTLTEQERWNTDHYNTVPDTAMGVYITLAFFEDLSMLYNENNLSRDLVIRLLKTMIIEYYESSEWFRKRMKDEQGESMYKEWDKLYKTLTSPSWILQASV